MQILIFGYENATYISFIARYLDSAIRLVYGDGSQDENDIYIHNTQVYMNLN